MKSVACLHENQRLITSKHKFCFVYQRLQHFILAARSDASKSRKENPQKQTQLSSRSHPRHLVGKRTAQKDSIIDITSDSQVNSNFPYSNFPKLLEQTIFYDRSCFISCIFVLCKVEHEQCEPHIVLSPVT